MDIGCEIINGNALLFSNINNDSKLKSNKLISIMLNCTYIVYYMEQMANFVISQQKKCYQTLSFVKIYAVKEFDCKGAKGKKPLHM